MAQSFEKLDIWQKGHKLMLKIYEITEDFPKSELYNLVVQLRRAALSVPANIAEAQGRFHDAETIHFMFNARGSCEEVRSHLVAAKDLPQVKLSSQLFEELNSGYINLIKGINGYIRFLKSKISSTD